MQARLKLLTSRRRHNCFLVVPIETDFACGAATRAQTGAWPDITQLHRRERFPQASMSRQTACVFDEGEVRTQPVLVYRFLQLALVKIGKADRVRVAGDRQP
jgi:hypothetical protein